MDLNEKIGERIGERIRRARQRLGWNQSELARQLGKPRQHLSLLEQGKQIPTARLLIDLAETLEVSTDYLLGRGKAEDEEEAHPALVGVGQG